MLRIFRPCIGMDNDLNTVLSVQVILALITSECIEYHN
jgi:hypothetical protein